MQKKALCGSKLTTSQIYMMFWYLCTRNAALELQLAWIKAIFSRATLVYMSCRHDPLYIILGILLQERFSHIGGRSEESCKMIRLLEWLLREVWLQLLNMHSLSKKWLKGDMVTIYKYWKSLNVKEGKAFSGYRREPEQN